MAKKDDIQKLITQHTRRLNKLKEQKASFGINAPPEILTEIEDVEDAITQLQAELEELNYIEIKSKKAQEYLQSIIKKYKTYESYYTDLAASVTPHIPMDFLAEQSAVQVLIERCFGEEYVIIERIRVPRLQDVVKDYPRIVLLGEPGGGKTVTIWQLALEYAEKAIKSPQHIWPVVIELGRYDGSSKLCDWLLKQGETVPEFVARLNSGDLLLLLDGLNELPRKGYSESISELKKFLLDYPTCPLVITCRRLNYDEALGLQQVEIEPLNKERIQKFISKHIKSEAGNKLYKLLQTTPKLMELSSNPLNLKLIVAMYLQVGTQFPRNRSKLMDGFIGALYKREESKFKEVSVSEIELRTALSSLAFDIQAEIGKGTSVDKNWALQHIQSSQTKVDAQKILNFAASIGLLDLTQSSLRFQHQLMQEYFVALELDKKLSIINDLQRRFWIPEKRDFTEERNIIEPLPPPPTTGWEEATIMLAGAKSDASELIIQIITFNPLLSARCIIEGRATVQPEVYKNVVKQLLIITEDPEISLNTRIQAGILLGEFEDPRFEKLMLPQGYALLPPMVQIPGDTYMVGSDKGEVSDSYRDEIPRHSVALKTFWIGKFPVTNSEFACFINSGGYNSPKYWTEQGWSWRQGRFDESLHKWLLDGYRNVRSQVLNEVDRLEPSRAEDSEEMDVWWKILMEWSDERVEQELDRLFDERNCQPHNAPCYWDDPTFNSLTQPVIATWFEAQAYCRWLSEITGKKYRLPLEAEWEAATGGSNRKRPWGSDTDTSRFNILPSSILRTTPVGIYPTGVSIFGVHNLLGNVWEWTSSAKFPYPYRSDDGRENPFLPDSRRVVRGGSWAVSESSSRNSCRGNFPPDNMVHNYIGFRVVCEEEKAI